MSGHGHVKPNTDGSMARCGGPMICGDCAMELAAVLKEHPPTTPTSEAEKYEEKIAALQKQLDERNEATKVWIQADTQTRAYANQLERKLAAHAERVRGVVEAARAVVTGAHTDWDDSVRRFNALEEAVKAYVREGK